MAFIKLILQFVVLLGLIGFITYIGENEKERFFILGNYEGFRKFKFFRVYNRAAYVALWFLATVILFEHNGSLIWRILQFILFIFGIFACIQTSILEHEDWLKKQKQKNQNKISNLDKDNSHKTFAEIWDDSDEKTREILKKKLIDSSFNSAITEDDIKKYAIYQGYTPIYIGGKLFFVENDSHNNHDDNSDDSDPFEDLDNYAIDEYLMKEAELGNTAAFAIKAERDRKRAERNI